MYVCFVPFSRPFFLSPRNEFREAPKVSHRPVRLDNASYRRRKFKCHDKIMSRTDIILKFTFPC